ncbi:MAG: PAS domain S-box protein [Dehalococcoidia bacterium]|nr:PAS domain S-box protein [Dehalococcoidia bacterium]
MGAEKSSADSQRDPQSGAGPEVSPASQADQSIDLYDSLFGGAPTGIYIVSDGVIRYVNRRMQVYTGRTRGDLQGQKYLLLVVPEDRDRVMQNLTKVTSGEHVLPYEYRIVNEVGDTRWVVDSTTSIQYEERPAVLGSLLDVTERKAVEQALKESEEGYKTLFESAEEGILVADSETNKFVYANPAICRMLGYDLEELWGMERSAIHPKEEWDRIASEIEAQAGGRTEMATNIPCITKDGRTIYVDINATTALVNGRKCSIGFFRDITERKRIEDELLQSEGKLRAMFKSIADGIIVTDLQVLITELNDATLFLHGYSRREELLGRSILDLVAEEDRPRIEEALRRAFLQSHSGHTEYRLLTRDGKRIHAELSAALMRDKSGKPTGFIMIVKDITQRKRAEEEILQRNRELAALHQVLTSITQTLDLQQVLREIVSQVGTALESSYTSIVMVNEDGTLGVGSEEYVDIPSLAIRSQQNVISRRIVDIPPSAITARPHGATRGIITSGQPHLVDDVDAVEGTNPVLLAAGIKSYAGVPIKVKNNIIGVLFVHSTRKSAFSGKMRLLIAFANEAGIAIENARLFKDASTVGALREADRLKTELLANVSHDLRTPLTSIKGYSTTILRHYQKLSDDEKRDFLREIDLASDRLTELIENLLQLSKLEAGGFRMNKEPLAIDTLIANCIEDMQQKAKTHRFTMMSPRALPLVQADPRRIRQVIDNLLTNAVKYSPEGTEITVSCEVDDQSLAVRVKDQGVGISANEIEKIFERFYQAASGTSSHRAGGVGLGLAICKGIIEAHKGRIWAQSELGKGSVFTFTLPLLQREESKPEGQRTI